ncbi:MAG: IclR family transcriptional regulator [Brachybacterium sp.]|uniref:IclR family transcriptional regulator n=1 Tax=Brachybacterium sp. TaxID=1891286 RepID=UPI0026481EB6|nr:IclR family transcriptional regulator [Brachybacterium sp.]MDN5685886.1 IclR family transcriptional regulator [Brachybacterium sp.]
MSAPGTPSPWPASPSSPDPARSPEPPRGTQALRRGLAVVQAVADGARTLSDISAATDLTKSTAHRLAQGLVGERIIAETGQGHYRLGGRLISWGGAAIAENPVTEVAGPVLGQLSETTQDTVHLACEDAGTVFYLDKIDGRRGATMRSRVGGREPLLRTGIGKALLLDGADRWEHLADAEHSRHPSSTGDEHADFSALMANYARRGVAMDIEENEPGIRCVAAPVRDAHGRIVAAISVSATTPYMASERMEALVNIVGGAARDISIGLGARPPFGPTG